MTNELQALQLPLNVVLLMFRAGRNSTQIVQSLTGFAPGHPSFVTHQQAVKKLLVTAFPTTFHEPIDPPEQP